MTSDELEDALCAWGRCLGENGGNIWQEDRSLTGNSPLAAVAGRRAVDPAHKGRAGQGRRRTMGGGQMVPTWACDPVPSSETRTPRPHYDRNETPTVVRVQEAWMALWRSDAVAGNVVRIHYQRRGIPRAERADAAGLTLSAYKDSLRVGKAFIMGNMARPLAA